MKNSPFTDENLQQVANSFSSLEEMKELHTDLMVALNAIHSIAQDVANGKNDQQDLLIACTSQIFYITLFFRDHIEEIRDVISGVDFFKNLSIKSVYPKEFKKKR